MCPEMVEGRGCDEEVNTGALGALLWTARGKSALPELLTPRVKPPYPRLLWPGLQLQAT